MELRELVEYAKNHSPFYREFYKDIHFLKLSDLPIIDQELFWKSDILTLKKEERSGMVFKSGGSTGSPKYSYFTFSEWKIFTQNFGEGIEKGVVDNGDKIANLFYVGDLYASFLFIKDSIECISSLNKKISHFPIAGSTSQQSILKTLEEFSINVLAGVPSGLLSLLENYEAHKNDYPHLKIEKILYGGETLYPDQLLAFKRIFPEMKIASIGIASVDGGLLGYCDRTCKEGEHRVFDKATIIELVDSVTGELILEENRLGRVLLTNLTRKLMPIIRYPAGDLAKWVEPFGSPDRKYKLMGRSDEAARLGTISVYFEDTRIMVIEALKSFKKIDGIQFQMILNHFANTDELTLRIAGHNLESCREVEERLIESFKKEKGAYMSILEKGLIHPLKIDICSLDQLEKNSRTGKLKRVIDNRLINNFIAP